VPTIQCLKELVESGSRRFPLFIGFLSADGLAELAEVPSFKHNTANRAIAANILDPPVEDWQRPIDMSRVERIAREFERPGTVMPNPVLLSENPYYPSRVRIRRERVSGALVAPTYQVTVGTTNRRTEAALGPGWATPDSGTCKVSATNQPDPDRAAS
jgi:hypothetical protein